MRNRFVSFVLVMSLAAPAYAGGDAAAGKEKALACAACHISTNPQSDTPHLAGQREAYITKQLKAYKSGDRKNPVMAGVAGQLSDADVANLAAFLSTLPAGDTTVPPGVDPIKKTLAAFPKDFPKGFVAYQNLNEADKKQFSVNYVNTAALAAVKAGKPLPDGTAILVSHSSVKLDASKKPVVEKDGSWAIEKLESYAGMEMRAGWGKDIPELVRNADWNYGVFTPDKAAKPGVNQTICLACHKPQAAVSYLFSFKELQAKATGK
jgi:cytochrome c553